MALSGARRARRSVYDPLEPRGPEPDWVKQAALTTLRDIALFCKTTFGFIAGPEQFAREWADGRRTALNPLGFLATAATLRGLIRATYDQVRGAPPQAIPFSAQLIYWLAPFLFFVAIGLLCHLTFFALRTGRKLRSTVAVALYVGGGPVTVLALILYFLDSPMSSKVAAHIGVNVDALVSTAVPGIGPAGILAAFELVIKLVFAGFFIRALVGLHRCHWWWALTSIVVAFVLHIALGLLMHHYSPGAFSYWETILNAPH